ncbi:MAG: glycosyltransferase family 2 protein, partial [Rubrivivax sp.]
GYSQVINPVYLARKGTMSMSYARRLILKNVAANHLKALRPEPWVDRMGRVRGNWIGFMDVIKGRVTPERIESL